MEVPWENSRNAHDKISCNPTCFFSICSVLFLFWRTDSAPSNGTKHFCVSYLYLQTLEPRPGWNVTILISSKAINLPTQRQFPHRLFLYALRDMRRHRVQRVQITDASEVSQRSPKVAFHRGSGKRSSQEWTRNVNLLLLELTRGLFRLNLRPDLWCCLAGMLALGTWYPRGVCRQGSQTHLCCIAHRKRGDS